VNIDTKRKVRIKSPQRLLKAIADPETTASKKQLRSAEATDAQPESHMGEEPQEAPALADDGEEQAPLLDVGDDAAEWVEAEPDPVEVPVPIALAPENPSAGETSLAESTADHAVESITEAASAPETRLSKLTVEELRRLYAEVIQRETSSTSKAYLVWKLQQAQKGRIPTGPRRQRSSTSEAKDHRVLPLRMEADLVDKLDEAWKRQGLRSRMELFRLSLHNYLGSVGEADVAALLAGTAGR
jgi:hypothetical protein